MSQKKHHKLVTAAWTRRSLGRVALSVWLGVLTLALTACGFHLRGSYNLPSFLHEITLRTPANSSAFKSEMQLALQRNNIVPQGGEVLLDVEQENLTRQTSTVDSSARAAEYTLVYTVEYRVSSVDRTVIGPLQSLILRRSYQYSSTNVVGKNIEEDTLIHELRIDAAQQIVRQLSTMKAPPAPPAPSAPPATSAEAAHTP